jgi:hypothetical protein
MIIKDVITNLMNRLIGRRLSVKQVESNEELIERANAILSELKSALRKQVDAKKYTEALKTARSIIQLGWWSITTVRYDSELDEQLHRIGSECARSPVETDSNKVIYVTSGILAYGGLTQQLVNHLEYHDKERFELHVFSTDLFPKSDLKSERAKRVKELCRFQSVKAKDDLLANAIEIAEYIEKERIGTLVLLLSPDDVIGLVLASMLPDIPSIFINSSHHVFTGGSFQFDAFVDVTGHYHRESVESARNANLVYISLCGRMSKEEAELLSIRDFKSELGLDEKTLLTATVGNMSKNTWGGDDSYMNIIGRTLSENPCVHHLFIGTRASQLKSDIINKYPSCSGRIHTITPTPKILEAMKGCDIYLNSFPMGGALSTLDAIASGLPVVLIAAHEAWFNKPEYTVRSQEEYERLLNRYVSDKHFRLRAIAELGDMYEQILSPKIVLQRYEKLILTLTSNQEKTLLSKSKLELVRPRVKNFTKRLEKISAEI